MGDDISFLSVSAELESLLMDGNQNTNLLNSQGEDSQSSMSSLGKVQEGHNTDTEIDFVEFIDMDVGSFLNENVFENVMHEANQDSQSSYSHHTNDDAEDLFQQFIDQLSPIEEFEEVIETRQSRARSNATVVPSTVGTEHMHFPEHIRINTLELFNEKFNNHSTDEEYQRKRAYTKSPRAHHTTSTISNGQQTQKPQVPPLHIPINSVRPNMLSLDLNEMLAEKQTLNKMKSAPTTPRGGFDRAQKSPRSKPSKGYNSPRTLSPRSPRSGDTVLQTLDQLAAITQNFTVQPPANVSEIINRRKSTDLSNMLSATHPSLRPLSANNSPRGAESPVDDHATYSSKLEKTLKLRKGKYKRSTKVHGYENMVTEFKFN